MATRQVLADLVRQFAGQGGPDVAVESVGGVDATRRVQAAEAFDIVALAAGTIDQLIAQGHVVPGSRTDFVRSGVAVAVPAGAPRPDLSDGDAVRRAVLAAPSIGYSTGPSGVQLVKLFGQWGIAEALQDRLVQAPPGVPVARLVAEGRVALGFQQLSELLNVPGVDIVGPLPPDIQINTIFSAGLAVTSCRTDAAQELLDFLRSPATEAAKRANGMDPA
jgi:molybdate transport system substrate-binding protein